jgi:AbrB family looped-hinge helix DNA binding protein
MRETIVPIDKAGRVVIPKWVREGVNLQAGDELKISLDGLQIRLAPAVEDSGTVRKGHALVFRSKSSMPLTSEMVDKLRDERLSSVFQGVRAKRK